MRAGAIVEGAFIWKKKNFLFNFIISSGAFGSYVGSFKKMALKKNNIALKLVGIHNWTHSIEFFDSILFRSQT